MIPSQFLPVANHLWQTTVFAGAAGLLTLPLRKNRARVRFWLWLSASLKFVIPFSILVEAGGLLGRHAAGTIAPSARISAASFSSAIERVGDPFTTTPAQLGLPEAHWSYTNLAVAVFIVVWAVGFALLVYRWTVRWRRIRAAVRTASSLSLPIGLPVKSSPAFGEPGVFGVLRPTLLLPDGIIDRLTPREMEAILAHELCHVRRHDNLTTSIHMVVELLFWFHPLVWWVGARLMEERERACDEEVLRTGGDPYVYAEGILKICELYLAAPLASVSGVTGGNLKRRIEGIVSNRAVVGLDYARKVVLTVAAAAAVAMPLAVGIVKIPLVHAKPQSAAATTPIVAVSIDKSSQPRPTGKLMTPQVVAQSKTITVPKFEAASIKPCSSDGSETRGGRGGNDGGSPGRLHLNCQTVMSIIQKAYTSGMPPLPPIEGGPGWTNSERYVIDAKAEGTPNTATMRGPMLQALLQDRFQLRTHLETKDVSGYALVIAKGGPKLTKHKEGSCVDIGLVAPTLTPPPPHVPGERLAYCGANHSGKGTGPNVTLDVPGVSLDYFARTFLGISFWGHPVINRTGITGLFDIHLEFSPDESTPGPPDMVHPPANPDGALSPADQSRTFPTIFDALQQQLGLKLEPAKAPREFLVIEHVQRPSEN